MREHAQFLIVQRAHRNHQDSGIVQLLHQRRRNFRRAGRHRDRIVRRRRPHSRPSRRRPPLACCRRGPCGAGCPAACCASPGMISSVITSRRQRAQHGRRITAAGAHFEHALRRPAVPAHSAISAVMYGCEMVWPSPIWIGPSLIRQQRAIPAGRIPRAEFPAWRPEPARRECPAGEVAYPPCGGVPKTNRGPSPPPTL